MSDWHLAAHVTNAISLDTAIIALDVASQSADGQWFTNEGREIWPFWTQPILAYPQAIPEGWIEHLHREAIKQACRATSIHTASLLERLGLDKPKQLSLPFVRRI